MRIKKISVNNLFGIFNHTIPLNLNERITIIHGPNGYGKTVILKMVNAIFHGKYNELFNIPFSDLIIEFDDGTVLTVKKDVQSKLIKSMSVDSDHYEEKQIDDNKLIFNYKGKNIRQPLTYKISTLDTRHQTRDIRSIIERFVPFISRIAYDTWSDDRTDELYNFETMGAKLWGVHRGFPRATPGDRWRREFVFGARGWHRAGPDGDIFGDHMLPQAAEG